MRTRKALPDPDDCVLGDAKPNIDFLLIGDSHANAYTAMLDVWAKDANLRGDAQSSTSIYRGTALSLILRVELRNLITMMITAHLAKTHYPVIILAGSYVPFWSRGETRRWYSSFQ